MTLKLMIFLVIALLAAALIGEVVTKFFEWMDKMGGDDDAGTGD